MKNIYLHFFIIFLFLSILPDKSNGQWRANLYGGYVFEDELETVSNGNAFFQGKINSTAFYGGGIEYVLQKNYGIELLYMREDAEVPITYTTGNNFRDTSITPGLGMNFIMLAGNGYTRLSNSAFELFGGFMLGAAILENKDPVAGAESSSTKFGYGFRAGTNIWVSSTFGIKVMGQMLSASEAFSSGFYVGTGGVSAGITPESSMLQWGIGGGITFKFGSTKK